MANSFRIFTSAGKKSPAYLAERMAVILLAELNSQMKRLGMLNSDLARAAGVSPAYITKLFRSLLQSFTGNDCQAGTGGGLSAACASGNAGRASALVRCHAAA